MNTICIPISLKGYHINYAYSPFRGKSIPLKRKVTKTKLVHIIPFERK